MKTESRRILLIRRQGLLVLSWAGILEDTQVSDFHLVTNLSNVIGYLI